MKAFFLIRTFTRTVSQQQHSQDAHTTAGRLARCAERVCRLQPRKHPQGKHPVPGPPPSGPEGSGALGCGAQSPFLALLQGGGFASSTGLTGAKGSGETGGPSSSGADGLKHVDELPSTSAKHYGVCTRGPLYGLQSARSPSPVIPLSLRGPQISAFSPTSPASLLGPEGLLGGTRRSPPGLTCLQGAEQQQECSGTGEKQPERPVSSRSLQTVQTAPHRWDWLCPQRNVTTSTASARRAVPGRGVRAAPTAPPVLSHQPAPQC